MRKHIIRSFEKIRERNWDRWYWAIDIHDTCIKANYSSTELPVEFFPHAKEALQQLSLRPECCLILFTCSHPAEIEKYIAFFKSHDIHFHFANENPEVPNTELGAFDKKFYTNIYLEDKAGFYPDEDWLEVIQALAYIDTHYDIQSSDNRY